MSVHEVGAGTAVVQPGDELVARLPLEVANLGEVLDLEAVCTREVEAGRATPAVAARRMLEVFHGR